MGRKARLKKEKKLLAHPEEPLPFSENIRKTKFLKKPAFIALLFLIFILGVSLRLSNLNNVSQRSPDEGVYTYQAGIVAEKGGEGIRQLVRDYNLDEKQWSYPAPTRIGYIRPLAFLFKATNRTDVNTGAYMSCFFSVISLLLLIVLGLRFFNRWITLYALLFMSVSPMALAIARRTWQDAMLGCLGFFCVWCCCEISRGANKIMWYTLLTAGGSYCILVKESGALIYALCIVWVLWLLIVKERSLLKGIVFAALSAFGIGISALYLSHAAGGIGPVMQVLAHLKEALENHPYLKEYASGPWYRFGEMLWILSPASAVLCFFGIAGTLVPAGRGRNDTAALTDEKRKAVFGIIFFMIAFMIILFLGKPGPHNLRYVNALYGPFYLISGLGLWHIVLFTKKIVGNFSFSIVVTCIAAVLIALAIGDYQNFKKVIVKSGIKDLTVRLLREASP